MKKSNTDTPQTGPLLVGLTGGIGVGKSFCAQIFEWLAVPIYNSDIEAKKIMVEDLEVKNAIIELCGKKSYQQNGTLNRGHIASVIFTDSRKLAQINAIVHPAVASHFRKWSSEQTEVSYVMQESALIFETGSYKSFDKVVVVHAPLEVRIQRTMSRDNSTEEQVKERISKQYGQKEKVKLADYVIHNDGEQILIPQILEVHSSILSQRS